MIENILSLASFVFCGHLFSFLCLSVPSLLRFFSHPSALGHYGTQTEGASGVEVLLAFGPPLGPSFAQGFGVASAASGFPNTFRILAISFRRLDTHHSCALADSSAALTNIKKKVAKPEGLAVRDLIYQRAKELIANGHSVTLRWVPGHS